MSRRVVWAAAGLAAVAAAAGYAAWKAGRPRAEPAGWLAVWKGDDGGLHAVTVDESKIPSDVVARLPRRRAARLLEAEVRVAIQKHGLFAPRAVNPHLQFGDGDVRFWADQPRPGWEVEVELLSRALILDVAEEQQVRIASQGDLSFWVKKLYLFLAARVTN